ncbi:copia protein [Tanacetum coccineum]
MQIIGTKWVFRNKLDENGVVSRNKAMLVAQDYNQQKGIDYDETYAPVARLDPIRILLAYACALDFKLFQMDVKNAFMGGFINKEAPKTSHLEAVKRIFRYIKGTTHLGLWYPKGTGIETVVYADSDHAGDYVDRKSTSGSGYQQKDRKPSQNDKTEHGMEKTVQNQGQSPKKSKSKSKQKNQQSNRSRN